MNAEQKDVQAVLNEAVEVACKNNGGKVAAYIPELASVPDTITGAVVTMNDGTQYVAGNAEDRLFTLQSAAKLIVLIGLLEEFGIQELYSWVRVEPSGDDFASVARLDQFGPTPSNPMLNAGAIALCAHIPGESPEKKLVWLDKWIKKLLHAELRVNMTVFASERSTGDRNRALAYLLKDNGIIENNVESVLDMYFSLCSFEANLYQTSYFSMLLANGGRSETGTQVISTDTVKTTVSIMATCGLYNESGAHLVRTGIPAKSSVSGFILAAALGHAGIATISPRVNKKGTSMRGELILQHLSKELGWHFAI